MKRAVALAIALAAAATALAGTGCGLGIHRNPSVAVTAPYHDHQKTIAEFPQVTPSGRTTSLPGVGVGTFVRYYAMPIGFAIGTAKGPQKSWGKADLVAWSELAPTVPPEQVVQAAFAQHLGAPATDAQLIVTGAITDLSWYALDPSTAGGRITTRLTVARRDGTPIFEGELSSTGRARQLETLLATHVEQWLADAKLLAALRAGGTP